MKLQAHTLLLQGTSYEIGQKLAATIRDTPPLLALHTDGMPGFEERQAQAAIALFDAWCPGLTDELRGFADTLGVPLYRAVFMANTSLAPRCGHIALPPAKTADGAPLVARSYEFNHEMEDFCLVKTAAKGNYTHMGTSVLTFGRDDGFNEHGLVVTMSSCGFPVGAQKFMRAPKVAGLQYWAVLRTLLENCRNTDEALSYLQDMPIAYNINLMLTDKGGNIALVETLDGRMAVKQVEEEPTGYLHATNHVVIDALVPHEPRAMRHSLLRYNWVKQQLDGKTGVTKQQLKELLHSPFPAGLCCDAFKEFFGTTKSMVIDPARGILELCWGGNAQNGWQSYSIDGPFEVGSEDIVLDMGLFAPEMMEYQPL